MNLSVLIMTGVLLVTIISPVLVYYAIKKARKGNYNEHRRIQTVVFTSCILAVVILELLIRISGGSGSLSKDSSFSGSAFFKTILIAHITGAVLTYILWTFLIIKSRRKYQTALPGKFSVSHKRLGIIVFIGLIYTGFTAVLVYLMTLDLI